MTLISLGSIVAVIWCFMSGLFLVSVIIKRNDIADIAWGPGIALASWTGWYVAGQPTDVTSLTVLTLISVWALRLGYRIGRKNTRKPGEDARYRRWREQWTWFYTRSYFQVYVLQGALMIVLSLPAQVVVHELSAVTPLFMVGAILWAIGFGFEVVGDYQLDRFINNPDNKGQLMRYGLWRYSRHPNYFGEITMWWALFLIVSSTSLWWVALISPVTITYLICFVSGIPLLEDSFSDHPEWAEYKRQTSVLIPLPPRS